MHIISGFPPSWVLLTETLLLLPQIPQKKSHEMKQDLYNEPKIQPEGTELSDCQQQQQDVRLSATLSNKSLQHNLLAHAWGVDGCSTSGCTDGRVSVCVHVRTSS